MLILRRKPQESIIINGNIRITLLAIEGKQRIKLGIEAPEGIMVIREELIRQIQIQVQESGRDREDE